MAGLGSACSHAAASLFKIESACHLKLTEVFTNECSLWMEEK